jgi:DNA-binding NtrC family response regulator
VWKWRNYFDDGRTASFYPQLKWVITCFENLAKFIKVGSSQVQKTDVRMTANVNICRHRKGRVFEETWYRLSTVDILLPPFERPQEIFIYCFRKFAADFAHKYKMPPLKLDDSYRASFAKISAGQSIRQLHNVAEQLSVLETSEISPLLLCSLTTTL